MERTNCPTRLPDAIQMSPSINFTQIKNELLHNPAISYKAKGLLCLLLSNQSGKWTSYQQTLQRFSREGSDAIRSGLKELEAAGYLLRLRYVDCTTKQLRGAFWAYTDTAWEFVMNTQLQFLTDNNLEVQGKPGEELKSYIENQKKLLDFPQLENPILGNPILGNQSLIILKDNNTKIKEDIIRQNSEKETSQNKSMRDRVLQLYNKYCPSLPKILKLTPKREKAINARLRDHSIRDIKRAFQMAEASDFLAGRIKTTAHENWRCDFDWLLNENNLVKVLEGKYYHGFASDSKDTPAQSNNQTPEALIQATFKSKDTQKAFVTSCWEPAQEYFNGAVPESDLIQAVVDFYQTLNDIQRRQLPHDMIHLMPGPMSVVHDYFDWLEDQDWIIDRRLNLLQKGAGPFIKWRRQWAHEVDNDERDPLTGKSYNRD